MTIPMTVMTKGSEGPAAARAPSTLSELLDHRAATTPDHVPLCVDGQIALTYRAWADDSKRVASALAKLPLPPNPRIALLFDGLDWIDYAVAYAAVLRIGGIVLHLNGRMPEAEVERRLRECQASWILHSPTVAPPPGCHSAALAAAWTTPPPSPNTADGEPAAIGPDIAEIRYTSGTTGPAKGYLVPHSNLLHNRTLDTLDDLSKSPSMLVPIWIGDSSSATILSIAITSLNRQIVCLPNDVERMGALIEEHGVQSLMLTPYVARQFAESDLEKRHDVSSVRVVALASSPLVPAAMRALGAKFPNVRLHIACAQSEASPALLTSVYQENRPFSIGQPTPSTEIRIVDDDGQPSPDGEVGEMWLRSQASKRLFLANPERNRQIQKDGWYRTGDMVRRTQTGDIEFFDRRVDCLTVGGVRESSAHLEAAISESPLVRDAAVVGFPGSDGQPAIGAFIVPRGSAPPDGIRRSLQSLLPARLVPDRIILLHDLPRTINGKLLKRHLRLCLMPPAGIPARLP